MLQSSVDYYDVGRCRAKWNHVSAPHVRTAIFTPVACFHLEQRSKSAVNKTQVIMDCLPRRGVIVCPDGGLASPKSVACENTGNTATTFRC